MTKDEHKAIIEFVARAVGDEQPPMDVEADAIIRALFVRNPDAAYRMTMLAMSLSGRPADEKLHAPPPEESKEPRKGWLTGIFERLAPAAAG